MSEKPRPGIIDSGGQKRAEAKGDFEVKTFSPGPTRPKDKVIIDEQRPDPVLEQSQPDEQSLSPEEWIQAQQVKKEPDIAPLRAELSQEDPQEIKANRKKHKSVEEIFGETPPLPKESQKQMTPEARRLFGTLPEKKQGLFASLREKIGLGKDAVEAMEAAMEYYKKQDQALKEADDKVESLARQLTELEQLVDKTGRDATHVDKDLEQTLDALSKIGLKDIGKDDLLKNVEAKAKKESFKLRIEQGHHEERRVKVQNQLEVVKNARERFTKAREKAKSEMDEAIIRAINANAQDAEQLRSRLLESRQQTRSNQVDRENLNAQIVKLEGLVEKMRDSTQIETIKSRLQKAIDQAKTLAEQQDALNEKTQEIDSSLAEHEKINEKTVSLLSQEKIAELLQTEENYWIAPLLQNRQLQALNRETIVKLVQSINVPKDRLFPKFDQVGLLDSLIADKTITQSREMLIARGILKKPADTATAETAKKKIPFVKEKGRFSSYLGRKERFGGMMDNKLGDIVTAWNVENPELKITLADKESSGQTISNSNAKVEILRLARKQHPQQERAVYKQADKFFLALLQEERTTSPEQHRQQATIPKNDTLKNWKQRLSKTELPLDIYEALENEPLDDVETMSILYDQVMKTTDEKLREPAKKRFAKFLTETFGSMRGRIVKESVTNASHEKFVDVVKGWNEKYPGWKIDDVPKELQDRSFSNASAKIEIIRLATGARPIDLRQRVDGFLKERDEAQKAQAEQEAQAAQTNAAATA